MCSELLAERGRLAQLVRASRLHREGRRFESYSVHHVKTTAERCRFYVPRDPSSDEDSTWLRCAVVHVARPGSKVCQSSSILLGSARLSHKKGNRWNENKSLCSRCSTRRVSSSLLASSSRSASTCSRPAAPPRCCWMRVLP